jgi:phosphofructokinase-like protein
MARKIAVLTAGGDCPGINAVIRAVVKTAVNDYDMKVVGIEDGFLGLIEGRWHDLAYNDVSGILTLGGTILGTSNKSNPFRFAPEGVREATEFADVSADVVRNFERIGADVLIAIGGDGTLHICEGLLGKGLPIVGIPKTIDNDVDCTDYTFGFDSAAATATEAIDKIHTTAQSHHRVMIIEVMGRYVGWLALHSGVGGGGDVILIPEIPCDLDVVCRRVLERSKKGRRFSIVVVAEGAKTKQGDVVVKKVVKEATDPIRLGGIGNFIAERIESDTGLETRVTVLGHLQRGGTPTGFDRVLATRFGSTAAQVANGPRHGVMVALRCGDIVTVPISDAIARLKKVPADHDLVKCALSVGTSFGI